MRDAQAVLTRAVLGPRMDAIAELAVAAKAAADPDHVRATALRRADKHAERANARGRELVEAARRKAHELREEAAVKRRDLLSQAEAEVLDRHSKWQAAYAAACAAGWTPEQLAEAGQPSPPARPPRALTTRRAAAAENSAADTTDVALPDIAVSPATPAPADAPPAKGEVPTSAPV